MKQFENVICKYGAPMGRTEVLNDFSGKIRCFKVKFVDGDYDDGGCYFGGYPSPPLYCATNQKGTVSNDNDLLMFTRAYNRKEAKAIFQNRVSAICGKTISWIN